MVIVKATFSLSAPGMDSLFVTGRRPNRPRMEEEGGGKEEEPRPLRVLNYGLRSNGSENQNICPLSLKQRGRWTFRGR